MDPNTVLPIATAGGLAGLAGMIWSMAAKYIPGLNVWFARLSSEAKSGIMAVMVVLTGVGSAFWTCSESSIGLCASGIDWKMLVLSIFAALSVNQTTNNITPDPSSVKAAKEEKRVEEVAAAGVKTSNSSYPTIDRDSFMRP